MLFKNPNKNILQVNLFKLLLKKQKVYNQIKMSSNKNMPVTI